MFDIKNFTNALLIFALAFIVMTTTTSVASAGESSTSSRAAERRRALWHAPDLSRTAGQVLPTDATRRKRAVQAIDTMWFLSITAAVASGGSPDGKVMTESVGESAD